MANINNYYGNSKGWRTYLEFYSKANSNNDKQIHRQLTDQDAYDTWHLAKYYKEILSCERLLQQKKTIKIDEIPRKEKNLLVYLLMLSMRKKVKIMELGHSLFELIEGLEVVEKFLKQKKNKKLLLDLTAQKYIGVDISDDFCLTAKLIHPEYSIKTFMNVDQVGKEPFNLLYDRNVTSYAMTSSVELANFINKSEVALMNLFVSKGDTFYSLRAGKTLTYFSLKELVSHLKRPLYHLFGEKAPGPFKGNDLARGKEVVEGFFLCSTKKFADDFLKLSMGIKEVKNYFKEKNIQLKDAMSLLK